jgi:hypothetical protein
MLPVAAAACGAATLLSLVNLRHLRRPAPSTAGGPTISVLIPARNEEARIGPTLRSLRELQGVHEVLVLDDNSSDATAELVRSAGLDVIESSHEPPPGWLGKPWACQRLAEAATGEVLMFIDADVVLAPEAARAAAALLTDVDLACPYPRQITNGWLQRLVQPLLQWSWLTFLPLAVAERSSHPLLSAGNGQFVVTRRESYFAAGGHASVRDQVLEDLALVRRYKHTGHRVAMADGTSLATCRMYASNRELVDGYTKSLHEAFAPGVLVLLNFMYVLPGAVALFGRGRRARGHGLLAYALAVAGRVAVATRTGQPRLDTLAHPLSILALSALYMRSVVAARRQTITWRGRSVAVHP